MDEYRVDRVDSMHVPRGMNSLVYLGRNYHKALCIFDQTCTGFDAWGQPDETYGLVLSQYVFDKRGYQILKSKGVKNDA
jgi:hypothetical protein